MKIKTIDINAKEWFDKINGNSYFAGIVTVNFGMKNEIKLKMPFQYGYGDHFMQVAFQLLRESKLLPEISGATSMYCRDNKIILRTNKQENCKKRELKNI